ncbi:MAG: poly-beta-1,6-N-acetyl-D-glucosamine biosynthesis protein PgaD [Nitrospiraceae bacterium]|nr:poly-beta-1,6-N-acetyl-D-glucosamine biosynthesis protein PgaD [Nitrospiraceae bacterium]
MTEKEIKIIERPDLKSRFRNLTETGITAFMWAAWIYLLMPLANILLWIFGIRIFYIELIEKSGFSKIMDMIYNMGWIAVAVFLSFWLWGYYNLKRYGKMHRRRTLRPRHDEKMLNALGISPELHRMMRMQKEVVFEWRIESMKDYQTGIKY